MALLETVATQCFPDTCGQGASASILQGRRHIYTPADNGNGMAPCLDAPARIVDDGTDTLKSANHRLSGLMDGCHVIMILIPLMGKPVPSGMPN
ncbi:hypothetical protein CFR78_13890 [Komagataeibacter rhaeticus]|nr:hypothetical protein GLUCORHAEAF1_05010 [Komagataeibacter rhaeticus AF1]PYD52601.1 hypothetical protein CFR78_13890 [Komagataeibacter rhaeticus]